MVRMLMKFMDYEETDGWLALHRFAPEKVAQVDRAFRHAANL